MDKELIQMQKQTGKKSQEALNYKLKRKLARKRKRLLKLSRKRLKIQKLRKGPLKLFNWFVKRRNYQRAIRLAVCIRTTSNNIFCTLLNKRKGTILLARSAGSYKYNVSKKSLKYYRKLIIKAFLKEIKICKKETCLLIRVQSSKGLKSRIIKQVCLFFNKCKIFLDCKSLKPFNGCRASKQKRKRGKGIRIQK